MKSHSFKAGKRDCKGFSHVELLTVIGITSIITAAVVASAMKTKEKALEVTENYVRAFEVIDDTGRDAVIDDYSKEGEINDD